MVGKSKNRNQSRLPIGLLLGLVATWSAVGCTDKPMDHQCSTQNDCRTTEVCRLGQCTQRQLCASDFDCRETEVCLDGRCGLLQCLDEDSCGLGRHCVDGWCLRSIANGCIRDEDCPSGRCLLNTGVCESQEQEDAAPCDDGCLDAGQMGCRSSADCPTGSYCAETLCVPGCSIDDDCPGQRCDAASRQCRPQECARDADCESDLVCSPQLNDEGQLLLLCSAALGPPQQDCAQDTDCQTGACLIDGTCLRACLTPEDCNGSACIQAEWRPTEDTRVALLTCKQLETPCQADLDCPNGQICLPEIRNDAVSLKCQPTPIGSAQGAQCTEGNACQSHICLNGRCWGPCAPGSLEHCGDGLRCYANAYYLHDPGDAPILDDDSYFGLGACLPDSGSGHSCAEQGCPDGEVCVLGAGPRRRTWIQTCRRAVGAGRGGAACMGDTECRSGWCGSEQFCLEPCRNGVPPASCVEGARCESVPLPLWTVDSMDPVWTARSEVCR